MSVLGQYLARPPRYGIGAAAVPQGIGLPTYIRITDIDDEGNFAPNPAVSVNSKLSGDYLLQDGDLVVARTGASVGKSYQYRVNDGELVFAGFLICIRPDAAVLDPRWLAQYLRSKPYWNWVASESTRSGQPGINARQLALLPVDAPSIMDQRLVADALTDTDNLVASLERLISKKRDIKQGIMQELLTVDAQKDSLGAVGMTIRGVGYDPDRDLSPNRTENSVDLLRANNVQGSALELGELQFVHGRRVRPDQYLQRDDILICAANGSKRLVGKSTAIGSLEHKTTFGAFMMVYRPDENKVVPAYVALHFQTKSYRDWIDVLLAGSSINNLRPSDVTAFSIPIPPRKEQERVAGIFKDVDDELYLLERRLESALAIKTGMMQELLSGRTRISVEEVVA